MSSDFSSKEQSTSSTEKKTAIKQLITSYHKQLTEGCGRSDCDNEFCASSPHFSLGHLDRNKAAAKAFELARNRSNLCEERSNRERSADKTFTPVIDGAATASSSCLREAWPENSGGTSTSHLNNQGTSETSLQKSDKLLSTSSKAIAKKPAREKIDGLTEQQMMTIIEECEKAASLNKPAPWAHLIHVIDQVFIEPEALMNSFLCSASQDSLQDAGACGGEGVTDGSGTIAAVQSKEDIRSMELDQDKDHDSESGDDEAMSVDVEPTVPLPSAERTSRKRSSSKSRVSSRDDSLVATSSAAVPGLDITLDLAAVRRVYARMFELPDLPFQSALLNAIIYLSRALELDRRSRDQYQRNDNYINIFLIIMEIPHLDSLEFLENATPNFCKALGLVPVEVQAKLVRVWSTFETDQLRLMVQRLQQLITVRIVTNQWTRNNLVNDDDGLTSATKVLKMLFYACLTGGVMDPPELLEKERLMREEATGNLNHLLQGAIGYDHKERQPPYRDPLAIALGNISASDCRTPLVPLSEFINESLSEAVEMDKDYTNYRAMLATIGSRTDTSALSLMTSHFSFMLHQFMLNTTVKNMGMFYDNRIRMMSERRESMFQSIMHGNFNMPYLRLRIRRDHIIDDSLVNLEVIAMDNPQDLKKQLYVEFDGEQGIDEGGVSKEFFQLILEEIFNPDIGMFTYTEETGTFWFNSTSFENDGQFVLIGIVLGLAIYNNVILDLHFPMVVYRKLMGKLGTFNDLMSSHPTIAQSLQELLSYEGDVEETFMQPFSVGTSDVFGNSHVHLLKENGDQIIVNNDTRQEFVDLYADFLLNKSVEKQFKAFQRGFLMVTDESPLSLLFYPHEIEKLICGSKVFDFQALEKATDYDGGYSLDTPVIKYFWDVILNELTDEQKRQFLQFTTGSDRAPLGGLSKLKLVIARSGPDSDRLPTSHTCFNVLLLPEYQSKEKLKERLLKAITYSKGFGML